MAQAAVFVRRVVDDPLFGTPRSWLSFYRLGSTRIGSLLKMVFAAFGVYLRHPHTKASNCALIALRQFSMVIGDVFAQVQSQLWAQVLIMCFAKGTSLTPPSILRKELELGTTEKPKETAILRTMIIHPLSRMTESISSNCSNQFSWKHSSPSQNLPVFEISHKWRIKEMHNFPCCSLQKLKKRKKWISICKSEVTIFIKMDIYKSILILLELSIFQVINIYQLFLNTS